MDRTEDSSVLFDWNYGHRPILSVLVTLGPKVVYAGRYKNGGKLSGEDPDLSFVTQPLIRMMEECGHQSWDTNRMPDSWWRVISGKAVVGQGSFFRLPAATPYPYSLPVTHQMQISKLPGYDRSPRAGAPAIRLVSAPEGVTIWATACGSFQIQRVHVSVYVNT